MDEDTSASAAPSGKRAERSRQAIVAAAREAFIRDGFDASMGTIAAAARVSKMTVYNHFGSKEDLFTEVVGQAMGEAHAALARVRAELADAGDPRDALVRTARTMVTAATDPYRLALRNLVTSELRRFPEIARSYQRYGPGQSAAAAGDVLRDLRDRGHLVLDEADVEVAVQQFFGLTLYPHLIAGSIGSHLPPELTERLIADGVGTFLLRYGTA